MWNYNEKDLEVEVGGGLYLTKSGCYNAIIKEMKTKTLYHCGGWNIKKKAEKLNNANG